MKLKLAYLCLNLLEDEVYCHELFERAPAGCCPACGSEAIMPVASLLIRPEPDMTADRAEKIVDVLDEIATVVKFPEPAFFCAYQGSDEATRE